MIYLLLQLYIYLPTILLTGKLSRTGIEMNYLRYVYDKKITVRAKLDNIEILMIIQPKSLKNLSFTMVNELRT